MNIRKLIREELARLSEMSLTISEYEKFIKKIQNEGKSKSGTYDRSDATSYKTSVAEYLVGPVLYKVTVNDATWGAEIEIRKYSLDKNGEQVITDGNVYIDYDTGTPLNRKQKQIIHHDKNPQFVQTAIYEIMKNGRKATFRDWINSNKPK